MSVKIKISYSHKAEFEWIMALLSPVMYKFKVSKPTIKNGHSNVYLKSKLDI